MNNADEAAEFVEGRGPAKGNAEQTPESRTPSRTDSMTGLQRVRAAAGRERSARFTALLHHVTLELLRDSYLALKRDAAPGIDGMTWAEYGQDLETRLPDLLRRVHTGSYRTRPSKRTRIPKEDGRMRLLGIASLEDKVVQRAIATVLEQIYEADFRGFSYGFRPGRSQHDALDALAVGLERRYVSWVLDADIRGFFDTINHEWLMRFLEHRIGDRRVLRLIRKWLRAGYLDGSEWSATETGTPQGAVISPLLANVYLHYVFDLWVDWWRRHHASGDVIVVRYADDFVLGFQHKDDAIRFLKALRERLAKFDLELHPEKTRLIEFGRFAAERRSRRGLNRPETFDFLGFTHICGRTRKGAFALHRKPSARRMRRKLKAIAEGLRTRMHLPRAQQGAWLGSVLRGWYLYYAVPGTYRILASFRELIRRLWHKVLGRRSQRAKRSWTWPRMARLADLWLPRPRILHPYPNQRLVVRTRCKSRMR